MRKASHKQVVKITGFLVIKQLRKEYFKIRYNSELYVQDVEKIHGHNSKSIKIYTTYCRHCRRRSRKRHFIATTEGGIIKGRPKTFRRNGMDYVVKIIGERNWKHMGKKRDTV
jgi:hypothetical protein